MGSSEGGQEQQEKIPLAEWIAGAVGLALVLGLIGFLVWQGLQEDVPTPVLRVEIEAVRALDAQYLVTFRVINSGGATAADVMVQGQLVSAGEVIETAQTQFRFVPTHSRRDGGLFFTRDPSAHTLEMRALGYERP